MTIHEADRKARRLAKTHGEAYLIHEGGYYDAVSWRTYVADGTISEHAIVQAYERYSGEYGEHVEPMES